MNLKIIGNVLTSKFVGTGPSSYGKRIYRTAVSQASRNTALYRPSCDTSDLTWAFDFLRVSLLFQQCTGHNRDIYFEEKYLICFCICY